VPRLTGSRAVAETGEEPVEEDVVSGISKARRSGNVLDEPLVESDPVVSWRWPPQATRIKPRRTSSTFMVLFERWWVVVNGNWVQAVKLS
jgi:hypothetical protein